MQGGIGFNVSQRVDQGRDELCVIIAVVSVVFDGFVVIVIFFVLVFVILFVILFILANVLTVILIFILFFILIFVFVFFWQLWRLRFLNHCNLVLAAIKLGTRPPDAVRPINCGNQEVSTVVEDVGRKGVQVAS